MHIPQPHVTQVRSDYRSRDRRLEPQEAALRGPGPAGLRGEAPHRYCYRGANAAPRLTCYLTSYIDVRRHTYKYIYIYGDLGRLASEVKLGLYTIFFLCFDTRINGIFCAPTLCLGTPPHPAIAHSIAQYNNSHLAPRYCNIYHTILAVAISC